MFGYTCHLLFNRLWHNWLTSTLVKVIRLDVASTQGQGLSIQRCISSSSCFPINVVHMSWGHPKSRGVFSHAAHLVMPSRTGPHVVHNLGHLEHLFIRVQSRHWPSCAHAMSLTDIVSDSGGIIQPLTLGLRCNTSTPMPPCSILEKPISKKVAWDTRLGTAHPHCGTCTCYRVIRLGHKA